MKAKIYHIFLYLIFGTALAACSGNSDPIPSEGQGWVTRHGLTSSQYQSEFDKWVEAGYRLTYVSGHQENRDGRMIAVYNAIWYKQESVEWAAYHGQTSDQYQTTVNTMKERGFQPVLVDGFNVGNTTLFASIFEKTSSDWVARHNMTSAKYQEEANTWVDQGYRIRHVSGYEIEGQPYYAAIFDKSPSPAWVARHDMSAADYQNEFNTWAAEGYQPVVISGFFVAGTEYFAAIWHKDNTRFGARHDVKGGGTYQKVVNDFYYEGYQPTVVDGYSDGSKVRYATTWQNKTWNIAELDQLNNMVETFRTANGIPSLSLAISKDERLVYAKAFGMADIENSESATTSHRYRIASLSKALTGAAVTKLIEENKLSLTDTVFGNGGVLGNNYGTPSADVATIQVQDLLEHTGGGWCTEGIMFTNNDKSRDWLITDTLANIPLTGTPATSFCYSNFGFSVLEAVIEARNGGVPYVDYIKQVLGTPASAKSLEVAGNTLADRLSNEVKYYDFFDPYIWNVTRMAGHGGWVVTPADYLRIMTRLDGKSARPDILGLLGINIYSRDDRVVPDDAWNISNGYYAKGLVVNNGAGRWDHNGNITGTLAEFMRYDDGYTAMLVINMRQPPSGNANSPRPNLKQLGVDIHNANFTYPSYNRF